MISQLRGVIVEKNPTKITLDVHGVGYELLIPVSTYEKLGNTGEQAKLLTYLHVREDTLQLYGFASQKERWMFANLISVSGIGPKLALSILSGCELENLRQFIAQGDVAALTKLSGVGRKTAQRLITELQEKLGGQLAETPGLTEVAMHASDSKYQEAIQALQSLGYDRNSATRAIQKVLQHEKDLSVEELVKKALQKI
ncbi:MAG: Holliday junction branch migration protein RuvA [Calditrichaeota bacterium]|nr:MAG: Holliday junction branch migration protein RuvA [Calditrichota bacterium]